MSRAPIIQPIILPAAVDRNGEMIQRVNRAAGVERLAKFAAGLALDRGWRIDVSEYRRRRSHEQNAYLWGVVYATLAQATGQEADDWHEYWLGEYFGWDETELFGRKRLKPKRRSSKLSSVEFAGYVEFIAMRAAEHGIYIPAPNEVMVAA